MVKASSNLTRSLLTAGVLAGPIYLAVGIVEGLTRSGFDFTRHDLSLLSNGDLGWIHIGLFWLTGALVIAAAVGMRRAMATGRGRTWAPLMLGLYGLGLIGAGIFSADPGFGFPPGTPEKVTTVSFHGLMHFVTAGTGFIGLIVACFIMARRFAEQGQRGLRQFSLATGIIFLAGFFGIASGSGNGWTILGFWIALIVAWAWISTVSAQLKHAAK